MTSNDRAASALVDCVAAAARSAQVSPRFNTSGRSGMRISARLSVQERRTRGSSEPLVLTILGLFSGKEPDRRRGLSETVARRMSLDGETYSLVRY